MTELKSKFRDQLETLSKEIIEDALSFDLQTNQPGEKEGKIIACNLIIKRSQKINNLAHNQKLIEAKKK